MFKLLALQVLDGCAKYIQKCLKTKEYYYFCIDYRFDIPGKVYRWSKYIQPLPDDFFTVPNPLGKPTDKTIPTINMNAIVGKNGDGKSTIVELIIRIVHDYIADKQGQYDEFKEGKQILPINGIAAVLYFQIDSTIYKLTVTDDVHQVVTYAHITDDLSFDVIDEEAPSSVFASIYTFVSNYSHYAYNIYDFEGEWFDSEKPTKTEDEKNEACWLFHIFHKNDGYATPLSLHPYRKSGVVDINKETRLSKQRLLYLFINASNDAYSFRHVLDNKKAISLRLSPTEESKFHQRTVLDHFFRYEKEDLSMEWADSALDIFVRELDNDSEFPEFELKKLKERYIDNILSDLKYILEGDGLAKEELPAYKGYIDSASDWLGTNFIFDKRDSLRDSTDMSNLDSFFYHLREIRQRVKSTNIDEYIPDNTLEYQYSSFLRYNIRQIARLRTIYDIAKLLEFDPSICFTQNELSTDNQCRLYMIYKAISIFETYHPYQTIYYEYIMQLKRQTCIEYSKDVLQSLYKHLREDQEAESHIARKFTQAEKYIQAYKDNQYRDIYRTLVNADLSLPRKASVTIPLDKLKKYYDERGGMKLENLPPAIFKTEIIFQSDGPDIEMSTLSSGEKQLFGVIGAVIYHLQNINSAYTHYDSVNLILEEIELYFHPEYQRKFGQLLIKQIHGAELHQLQNINITFVTHSPFVLSDIPKCNVLFLKEGKPDYGMQENTFGANIHSLLKNGFFLPNLPMGEFAYQKINELFRILNENDFEKNLRILLR